jgi:hypothetical protein
MLSCLLIVADVAKHGAIIQSRFAAETISNDMVEVEFDAEQCAAVCGLAFANGALEGIALDLFAELAPHDTNSNSRNLTPRSAPKA